MWGDDLKAGPAQRDPALGPLQISAGGMVAIGDELVGDAQTAILDIARPMSALYVGGMGARDKNFYNTICQKYGYVDEAIAIQDLYLAGKKEEAAARVPRRDAARRPTSSVRPATSRNASPPTGRPASRTCRSTRRQGSRRDHRTLRNLLELTKVVHRCQAPTHDLGPDETFGA